MVSRRSNADKSCKVDAVLPLTNMKQILAKIFVFMSLCVMLIEHKRRNLSMPCVISHPEHGVFIGTGLGLAFWTNMECAGQEYV